MIIDCPDCNKKFDIDQHLIPANGRLLQCGSCSHKWFFKLNIIKKKSEEKIKIESKDNLNINVELTNKDLKEKTNVKTEKIIQKKKKEKKKHKLFKYFVGHNYINNSIYTCSRYF